MADAQAQAAEKQREGRERKLVEEIHSLRAELRSSEIDNKNFELLRFQEVPGARKFLVLKVKYPSCPKCSYEGVKVMVFSDVTLGDVVFWRTIDPHFFVDPEDRPKSVAPSPIARFHGTDDGWLQAIRFASANDL